MERVLVVDYGGQYTHLIARRCRELGVYAEIIPQEKKFEKSTIEGVKGIILSGGPRTVTKSDLESPFQSNFKLCIENDIKILGICFGHQLLAVHVGGQLAPGGNPEYGETNVEIIENDTIFKKLDTTQTVWMSHSDEVKILPDGMIMLAISGNNRVAAFTNQENSIFGIQFHPEVSHTTNGYKMLESYLRDVCNYTEIWKPEDQIKDIINEIRSSVGESQVLMATSGGVDSTVAAYLIREAIGSRLFCVFVDNGLLRQGEREEIVEAFNHMDFGHFEAVDAFDEFIDALRDIETENNC